ncbi:MAG: response regulator transcription factor [Chloroflexi bacterium]|nr:response regulator transcription factor [Chloroflexota bacterium]
MQVLIADDHSVVRKGLRDFLQDHGEIEVVGEAIDGAEAVRLARELKPDVVLMDLIMPGMDGIQAITLIENELPSIKVIALTGVLDEAILVNVMRAGAIGFLLKSTEADELVKAIKAAMAGQIQLSPEANAILVRQVRASENHELLTERENDVLALLAQGRSNKEIARALNIGEGTVKTHVSKILVKLGLPSRTQAALYAVKNGLVSTPSKFVAS